MRFHERWVETTQMSRNPKQVNNPVHGPPRCVLLDALPTYATLMKRSFVVHSRRRPVNPLKRKCSAWWRWRGTLRFWAGNGLGWLLGCSGHTQTQLAASEKLSLTVNLMLMHNLLATLRSHADVRHSSWMVSLSRQSFPQCFRQPQFGRRYSRAFQKIDHVWHKRSHNPHVGSAGVLTL